MKKLKTYNEFESIEIPIEEGDIILGGRFKNKKVVVKEIGKDDNGQPTVNGKPLLKYRLTHKSDKKNEGTSANLYQTIVGITEGKLKPTAILEFDNISKKHSSEITCKKDKFEYKTTLNQLNDDMNLTEGVLNDIAEMEMNTYDYYVDESEIYYIHFFINEDDPSGIILRKISNYTGIDVNFEEEAGISDLLKNLNIGDVGDEYLRKYSELKDKALKKKIKKEITDASPLTYYIHYVNDYDHYVEIGYDRVITLLEQMNLTKQDMNLVDLLEVIGNSYPYTDEISHELYNYEDIESEKEVKKAIYNSLVEYWNNDKPTTELYKRILLVDLLDLIKDKVDEINWEDTINNGDGEEVYLFQIPELGSKCNKYIISKEFMSMFNEDNSSIEFLEALDRFEAYCGMKELGIL